LDYAFVRSKIDELCINNMFFNGDTVKLMKTIVPEFVSKNSEFCELDSKDTAKSTEKTTLKVVQS
jgi:hypothetical protein